MNRTNKYVWVYLLVGLGYLWVIWNLVFPYEGETTVCIFKSTTGVACPSCGSTRSLLAILKGDFAEAFFMNPLGYFGLFMMVAVPVMLAFDRWQKSNLITIGIAKFESMIRKPRLAVPLVALLIMNWVWNIYKGI